MSTATLKAPSAFLTIVAKSGNAYTSNASSVFANVVAGDVLDLINGGCQFINASNSPLRFALLSAFNLDGSSLNATGGAGLFSTAVTPGTSLKLKGETANNSTKTDYVIFEHVLPASYVAGTNLTLTVNANYLGAGTAGGTKAMTATAYKGADDGTEGANLIATAAATLTGVAADEPFVITGTTLNPGDRILIELMCALQETASSALNAYINSVRIA